MVDSVISALGEMRWQSALLEVQLQAWLSGRAHLTVDEAVALFRRAVTLQQDITTFEERAGRVGESQRLVGPG